MALEALVITASILLAFALDAWWDRTRDGCAFLVPTGRGPANWGNDADVSI